MIPGMIDRRSLADQRTDKWLADHDAKWRWPRYQGGQLKASPDPIVAIDPIKSLMAREELTQILESAAKDGLNLAVLDAPAKVSTAAAARMAHCTRRAVQLQMKRRCAREHAGQMSLPGIPAAVDVYAAASGVAA